MRFLYILFFIISLPVMAQREVNLFFMESVHQSSYINPAAVPDHKVSIGLPAIGSIQTGFTHPSFAFGHTHDGNKWNVDDIINNRLNNRNLFHFSASVELFTLRMKVGKYYFSLTNSLRSNNTLTYPGDLFKLMWNGNASQDKFDLSAFGADVTAYTEHGIGFTREFRDFTIGGRIKLLNGLSNIHTRNHGLSLHTKRGEYDHYALEASGEVELLASGYLNSILHDENDEELLEQGLFSNIGVAIDLGINYHLNDKIELFGSITDIGFIRWRHNTSNYSISESRAFSGLEFGLADVAFGDVDFDSLMTSAIDSLRKDIEHSSEEKSYTTTPIAHLYLGGTYQVFRNTRLLALTNIAILKGVRASMTVGAQQKFRRLLSVSITNTIQYRRLLNLGIGLMVKPGPFQLYIAADNISDLFTYQTDPENSFMIPHKMNNFNVRLGMNLVFGKVKGETKLQTLLD